MLNNRGQSLVMFIVMIPIMLLILCLVIDMGNVMYYKSDISNINKIVIDYGLDNIDSDSVIEDMKDLVSENNSDIEVDIEFVDMEFMVSSKYYVNGIFSNILDMDGFLVVSEYKGYIGEDDNYVIEKIK